MSKLSSRLERLEQHHARTVGYRPEHWEPPTREAVAAYLAPILPIYAVSGLLDREPLDEAGILALCRAMEWPVPIEGEPASTQDNQLWQAVLARCGMYGATA